MAEYTTLQKCWYKYVTGEKRRREHIVMKLVCTECHYIWDTQGFAFRFCPGCGKSVVKVEEAKDDGSLY